MLQLDNVSLYRGDQCLLQGASVSLHPGWHVGLSGRNGSGKSSLFAALRGQLTIDAGNLKMPATWRIAHMAQDIEALDQPSLDFVLDGDTSLRHWQDALAEAQTRHDDAGIAHALHQLDLCDAYTAQSRAAKILHGLGFSQLQLTLPVKSFSGGWRMRLNLARTLMCPSDLMLLDEPTNHLDLDAILWLEQWLRQYPGALIIISHDREFLDAIVEHLLYIENSTLTCYSGNYSDFERQRAERLAQQQLAFERQQARVAHLQKFIDRFKAKASKARQAQSRVKALEKLERISPAHFDSPFSFSFRAAEKCSDPLMAVRDGHAGHGDTTILRQVSLRWGPETRVGLLGPNGAGKSTLIKTLAGELPALGGEWQRGEHCRIGYFAQHQLDHLDLQATPLLTLQRIAKGTDEATLRQYLGSFGFQGDDVHAPIGRFSGGEKSRLALAVLIWDKPNVLLLDEPTNHLDLDMRHALTVALQDYQGALVLVSHDRHLLRSVCDEFWLVAEGRAGSFDGDVEDYGRWLADHRARQAESGQPSETSGRNDRRDDRRRAADARERLRPFKQRVDALERALETATTRKHALESQLADSLLYEAAHKDRLRQILAEQATLTAEISRIESDWLEAVDALETASQA